MGSGVIFVLKSDVLEVFPLVFTFIKQVSARLSLKIRKIKNLYFLIPCCGIIWNVSEI